MINTPTVFCFTTSLWWLSICTFFHSCISLLWSKPYHFHNAEHIVAKCYASLQKSLVWDRNFSFTNLLQIMEAQMCIFLIYCCFPSEPKVLIFIPGVTVIPIDNSKPFLNLICCRSPYSQLQLYVLSAHLHL